jgi:uncharacterized protein (DUF58 family)
LTRSTSPKLGAYLGLAGLGLLTALAAGRPELAVMAAPFALVAAAGLLLARDPQVSARLELEKERALQGDELDARLVLRAAATASRLEVLLVLPPGVAATEGQNPIAFRLRGGDERTLEFRLRCERWGGYALGEVLLRARDAFSFHAYDAHVEPALELKVYPREEALRELVRPRDTQVYSGDEVSRRRSEGIEFADLRQFVFGDPLRHVNWRASARRGQLWVNERHPERNTDVVLFLDTFSDVRTGSSTTVERAVRAAASIISVYLERRDRVGLVSFGGVLRWLMPGMGIRQEYRIIEALLDTEVAVNYAWKGIDVIPIRTLPPKALVLAVTPLLDERSVGALFDLRGRAFDVAVVDVSPVPTERPPSDDQVLELAYRIWIMERETLHRDLRRAGIWVAEWRDGDDLQRAVWEVEASRRGARLRYA